MKKNIAFLIMLPLLLCCFSCSDSENNKMIVGNWSGIEWLVEGQPSDMNAQGTSFSFQENGTYTYDYSGTKQKGKYKVENDMLFTTPEGQLEIMVRISKLTKDSLVFDMNRGGRPELLVLVRK